MAETDASTEKKLYTLSEVSKLTGISMPTLQRYKKMYQDRLPAEGAGRKQRYLHSALPIFEEIKKENEGKRGRPRKVRAEEGSAARPAARRGKAAAAVKAPRGRAAAPAPPAPKPGRPPAVKAKGLLTLTQISNMTGISYPTLVRYVKLNASKLRHEGTGRSRRFYPEAVAVFKELRSQRGGGGGRPAKAPAGRAAVAKKPVGRPAAARVAVAEAADSDLSKRVRELEKQVKSLTRRLEKGVRVVFPD